MIHGRVNQYLEPVVAIPVLDSHGFEHEIEYIVDTGFDGYLCLPSESIGRLGLVRSGRRTMVVADGSQHTVDTYSAMMRLHGRSRVVLVIELGDTPLVGMRTFEGSRILVEIRVGGALIVEEEHRR